MHRLKIGFIRRGYSRSGGAEAYLKRLAQGLQAAGHESVLVTSKEWPAEDWPFGQIERLPGESPRQFADHFLLLRPRLACDVTMSLERVWECDVFRAGDGVHRAWLERRARAGGLLAKLSVAVNPKHRDVLRLEESLFVRGGARRVIANSALVKGEIVSTYDYPADRIDVVYNGVPLERFRIDPEKRAQSRRAFHLSGDDIGLLFVGSGWERKGLQVFIEALKQLDDPRLKLLVAGRGNARKYQAPRVQFLAEVADMPALYAAADVFVLPTLYDPFSNACLEALASGLPVITTAANGFAEIIDDGVQGTILAQGNSEALAAAIKYWSDASRRAAARPLILECAGRFDISRNVAQTLAILTQSAANAASTSGKIRKT